MKYNNLIDKNVVKGVDINPLEIDSNKIKDLIYTIRGKQVMIDRDLASLYQVQTKRLNEQVKRNEERFPKTFRFQLNDDETAELVANCDRLEMIKHSTSNPYVFTEQGIAMLSAVLRSSVAIQVSINIMNAFVEMRRFLISNQELFSRIDNIELNQVKYQNFTDSRLDSIDKKVEQVFNYIAEKKEVLQKVFFDGQIYDAYSLLVSIIKKANKNIILIDNFVDTTTLDILVKRQEGVKINIYTSKKSKLRDTEIVKFNKQYGNLTRRYVETFHDRFMILDNIECYHIGTSVKDAGNKSFAITKIEDPETVKHILSRLKEI